MARFENLQPLFELLWRNREAQSLDSLCSALSVSPATVKRSLAFLRDQRGFDIRYEREQQGYVLHRGPQDAGAAVLLGLDGAEVASLLEAEALLEQIPPGILRKDTQPIRNGLQRIRQARLGKNPLKERLLLRMSNPRQASAEGFSTTLSGLRGLKRLRFEYRSRSHEEPTQRLASPIRLTFYRSNWYLAAWCHQGNGMRVFSLDRMGDVRILQEEAYQPPAQVLADELDSGYGIFTGKADKLAVLQFSEVSARWAAEEVWHPKATSERLKDGGVILKIPYRHDTELVMEILRYAGGCEVLQPPELRKSVELALRAALGRYRTDPE